MATISKAEFVKWFGPLLDALRDLGDSGRPREVSARIATNLALPDEVLDETLKSGASRFQNQVAWARQYLVWEGLVDSSKRGTWTLTELGRSSHLTDCQARQIFLKWVAIHAENRKQKQADEIELHNEQDATPEEVAAEETIDLITTLRGLSPGGFEKVCRELLRESGFEKVEITGGTADEGIDGHGILEINPLSVSKCFFSVSATPKEI